MPFVPQEPLSAPLPSHESDLENSPRKPEDPSAFPQGCWGPCKESTYLALKATNPSITRFKVSEMFDLGQSASTPTQVPYRPDLDLSNPRWSISATTLKDLLGMYAKPRLIDARLPAEDTGVSIPEAFPLQLPLATETLQAVLPDKNGMVVVFGNDETTMTVAEVAAELRRLGYANVLEFKEGLKGWIEKGGVTIITRMEEPPEPVPPASGN
ncbi:MAG TPA: rhodanese-like domain-containing protein [Candidatus Ozemobacteraceae bacterium]|nr:rhodanese-like domain-containing protein [Candidatus Ozemobacteraceae bacterium]HQG28348.1 rhodanese-like domain-containing protein [Candidatus Ozemobacteraceae bacterium]